MCRVLPFGRVRLGDHLCSPNGTRSSFLQISDLISLSARHAQLSITRKWPIIEHIWIRLHHGLYQGVTIQRGGRQNDCTYLQQNSSFDWCGWGPSVGPEDFTCRSPGYLYVIQFRVLHNFARLPFPAGRDLFAMRSYIGVETQRKDISTVWLALERVWRLRPLQHILMPHFQALFIIIRSAHGENDKSFANNFEQLHKW